MKNILITDNGHIHYEDIQKGSIHIINNIPYKIYRYGFGIRKVKYDENVKPVGRPFGSKTSPEKTRDGITKKLNDITNEMIKMKLELEKYQKIKIIFNEQL